MAEGVRSECNGMKCNELASETSCACSYMLLALRVDYNSGEMRVCVDCEWNVM